MFTCKSVSIKKTDFFFLKPPIVVGGLAWISTHLLEVCQLAVNEYIVGDVQALPPVFKVWYLIAYVYMVISCNPAI